MKLYITRHGQTEWNILKIMQGWKNSDLTNKGIEDAIRLRERLKDIEFSKIYSSPSGRALDTANYVKGNKDIEIEIHEGLKEMGFGSWEGMDREDVLELYSEEHYNYWNRPHLYAPSDGETFQELFKRVESALKFIIENSDDDNVLIVSHAITIKAIYYIIQKYRLEDFWDIPFIEGTSLSILEIDGDNGEFILDGDISHLE